MVFDLYECHIHSDAVTSLFWIFFFIYIYSLFFAGESQSLVKNIEDLFNIARSILVQFPSYFSSKCFVSIHLVHQYNRIDSTTAWKKLRFILSVKSDFHMTDNRSIAVHAFANRILMSFGARDIVVITVGDRYSDSGSNSGRSCISHSANTLGKRMSSTIFPPAMDKW